MLDTIPKSIIQMLRPSRLAQTRAHLQLCPWTEVAHV